MAVGDAGEHRDHFVVAFKRVHVDDAAAAGTGREAGAADEFRNAGFPEYVGQLLARHPQRLDAEEPIEQPVDIGVGGRDAIAIAGKRLQLAFLALEPAAERLADPGRGRLARRHDQHRAIVDRGLVRQHRHRIGQIAPAPGLLRQGEHVDGRALAYRSQQRREIGIGGRRGKVAIPQRHVEGGVPAAHEGRHANAVVAPKRKRQQQQWAAFGVIADDDEGREALALADLALPAAEEIEVLIGRRAISLGFEAAPDRFRLGEIVENFDAGEAARFRWRWRIRGPAFDRGSHGHRRACHPGISTFFRFGRPLQRSVNKR